MRDLLTIHDNKVYVLVEFIQASLHYVHPPLSKITQAFRMTSVQRFRLAQATQKQRNMFRCLLNIFDLKRLSLTIQYGRLY